jgi:TonB family protein
MLKTIKANKFTIFLLLALLAHCLLFLSFAVNLHFQPAQMEMKPLPAYIYREEKYSPQTLPSPPVQQPILEKPQVTSKVGIEKPAPEKPKVAQAKAATLSMGNGMQNVNLMLKSKNNMDKPLLNLITKAVAAHLAYPKIAMDFHLRGRALIGFIIYPDGHLTDVTLLQSSGTEVLDEAAVATINKISPVKNVAPYLTKEEPLVMGIIFQ